MRGAGVSPARLPGSRAARQLDEWLCTKCFAAVGFRNWDVSGGTYFITACLAGSIPAQGLLRIREVQDRLRATRPKDDSADWKADFWKRTFVEQEKWLDNHPAVRHLERPDLAAIVANAFRHFDGVRYESIAHVVMPSHIHWLFRPLPEWSQTVPDGKSPREVILHSF